MKLTEYQINLKDIKERIFKDQDGWSNYIHVSIEEMDWLVEQAEKAEQLEETVRIYKVVDEHVKEQSKKVKHIFPLENTVGYGQLCDKVLELTEEKSFFVKAYTEKIMTEG
jgi:hypothetical protein